MRTYWLHSVWVLGFFLSLFSLQGTEGFPGPSPPLLPAAGLWGGPWGKERSEDGRNAAAVRSLPSRRCAQARSRGVLECADRLAAISVLVGRSGTGVCVLLGRGWVVGLWVCVCIGEGRGC